MNKNKNFNFVVGTLFALVANILVSNGALADWTLDAKNSNLSYGTVKNDAIGENNTFKNISGHITETGQINLEIDLSSVDTLIELRNQRMRDIVFKVANNPKATLSGNIDLKSFEALKIGENKIIETSLILELVGEKTEIDVNLVVVRLGENNVMIVPQHVIFVDGDDFELTDAIEILRGLAGLETIATVVPLSFYLTFNK